MNAVTMVFLVIGFDFLQVFGEPYDDEGIGRMGKTLSLLAVALASYVGLAYFTHV